MATSTFERKIILSDEKSINTFKKILEKDVSQQKISSHPFSELDLKRSEELLIQCLSHSKC